MHRFQNKTSYICLTAGLLAACFLPESPTRSVSATDWVAPTHVDVFQPHSPLWPQQMIARQPYVGTPENGTNSRTPPVPVSAGHIDLLDLYRNAELENALPGRLLDPSIEDAFESRAASYQEPRARTPQTPVAPSRPSAPSSLSTGISVGSRSDRSRTSRAIAGAAIGLSLLSERRSRRRRMLGTSLVSGTEARFRAATDAGSLLGKSLSVRSVTTQQRNPVNTDTRVRGSRAGQLAASGSHWEPARMDLDTMLSKLDSDIVEDIAVINGPYSAMHGPGFNFIDVELRESPRSEQGTQSGGRTSLEYKTNGEQWYGRQNAWIAGEDYGLRISYGHRTGSDYDVGRKRDRTISRDVLNKAGDYHVFRTFLDVPPGDPISTDPIPSSYKSRDVEAAFGFDPTPDSRFEFAYLRMDQTDVEFPGLVFDINYLVTNAFEGTWQQFDQSGYDNWTTHAWHNKTRFAGDTFRGGKNRQIHVLGDVLRPSNERGAATTNVSQSSSGFQSFMTAEDSLGTLTTGIDLRYLTQDLNDIENPANDPSSDELKRRNFPIPDAWSVNPGIFVELSEEFGPAVTARIGGRIDFVAADAANNPPLLLDSTNMPTTTSTILQTERDQEQLVGSAYLSIESTLDEHVTLRTAAAFSKRPPNLTERYAVGSFIGSLQPGLTFLVGDPLLDPEQFMQVDIGLAGDWGSVRASADTYFAWIGDYITYDAFMKKFSDMDLDMNGAFDDVIVADTRTAIADQVDGLALHEAHFLNTKHATLAGFELAYEQDFSDMLTGFATMSYVEGRDRTRQSRARTVNPDTGRPRSEYTNTDREPLPGIPPLESRLGLRLADQVREPNWLAEVSVRVVDNQNRIARSLLERETPGFSVWDFRSFWRPKPDWTIIAGVENFTDKFYREHLDFRTGFGVYRPGVSFYLSTEVSY